VADLVWTDTPQLRALAEALDSIPDAFACGGEWTPSGPVALDVPDRGTIPIGPDAGAQLAELCEPADFGDGDSTRRDPAVRDALRLPARGAVVVRGFDPRGMGILDQVERALSPREKLRATLLDVHVYPKGGHFVRHKDTPRDLDVVGTLVVGLPVPFRGGALRVGDGRAEQVFDWGSRSPTERGDRRGAPGWAAFHGDVDHRIDEVTSGHRVTLAYALSLAGVGRDGASDRAAPFREALRAALADRTFIERGGDLLVPCARLVISERQKPRPLDLRSLRGLDREIAEAAASLDLEVAVRPCLAFSKRGKHSSAREALDASIDVVRLKRPVRERAVAELGGMVSFADTISSDEGELELTEEAEAFARHVLDIGAPHSMVLRREARATLVHETAYSATGYFGNEHYDALVYSFAAIEVAVPDTIGRGLEKPPPPPEARRVKHAKFGTGVVRSVDRSRAEVALEVEFEDGTVRKLLERFVQPV
jgi:hypothetical protein